MKYWLSLCVLKLSFSHLLQEEEEIRFNKNRSEEMINFMDFFMRKWRQNIRRKMFFYRDAIAEDKFIFRQITTITTNKKKPPISELCRVTNTEIILNDKPLRNTWIWIKKPFIIFGIILSRLCCIFFWKRNQEKKCSYKSIIFLFFFGCLFVL